MRVGGCVGGLGFGGGGLSCCSTPARTGSSALCSAALH